MKKGFKTNDIVFMGILFLYAFIHVQYGVELADTSYNLGNYENMQNMGMTWTIATLGANIVGKILTLLPGGHTWLGMNIYATFLIASCVVAVYIFLHRYMTGAIIFLGEILALSLCWCPHVILYNYLTYIILTIIIIVLIKALENDSQILMGIAGGLLAMNVFVRFPNICEVMLIFVVWIWGYYTKEEKKKIFINTASCVGGFFLGLCVICGIVTCVYGSNAIPSMVISLISMSDNNPGYGPFDMIRAVCFMYQTTTNSVILLAGIALLFSFVFIFVKREWIKFIAILIEIAMFVYFLLWEYRIGFYNFDYCSYYSFQHFAILFLEIAILISVFTILSKKSKPMEKVFAVVILIVIIITPLGSNNALFPVYNNLFLVAPMTLWLIWTKLFSGVKLKALLSDKGRIQWLPVRVLATLLMITIFIQCIGFGVAFVFGDSGISYDNSVKIEGNKVLIGMRTNPKRAEQIERLTQFVAKHELAGKKCIIFGQLPGISYILDMPCAISHTWPDLGSYTFEEMERDIEKCKEEPVVFLNTSYYPDILSDKLEEEKAKLLSDYLRDHDYELQYSYEGIAIYFPSKME